MNDTQTLISVLCFIIVCLIIGYVNEKLKNTNKCKGVASDDLEKEVVKWEDDPAHPFNNPLDPSNPSNNLPDYTPPLMVEDEYKLVELKMDRRVPLKDMMDIPFSVIVETVKRDAGYEFIIALEKLGELKIYQSAESPHESYINIEMITKIACKNER